MTSLDQFIAQIRDTVVEKDAGGAPVCLCGVQLGSLEFLCAACSRRTETDSARREIAERDERWREEVRNWAPLQGVPDWTWARLDNQDFTGRIRFPRLLGYAQRYEPAHGSVVLSSDTGFGKTSLTCAMLHRLRDGEVTKLLARPPGSRPTKNLWALRDLVWATGFDVTKARRENSLGEGESRLVQRAMTCKLLVLDEVGFEVQHDTVIAEIANARYVAEKPTIVTTGLRADAFAKRYGDACYRRLTERGTVVEAW